MPKLNRRLMLAGAGVAVAAAAFAYTLGAGAIAAGKAEIGTWGFDLSAMDRSIKPGDDFFRYAGGTWMKTTKIPAARTRWGSFNILGAKSEADVKDVIEQVAAQPQRPGSIEQKVADYYRSYMDTKAIDAAGLKP